MIEELTMDKNKKMYDAKHQEVNPIFIGCYAEPELDKPITASTIESYNKDFKIGADYYFIGSKLVMPSSFKLFESVVSVAYFKKARS